MLGLGRNMVRVWELVRFRINVRIKLGDRLGD